MERYSIPMEVYGSSRSLSTKRAQRDMNDLKQPMEDPIAEPGKLTVVMKFPYRQQELTLHIQLGRYYPFHPPNILVEYEHTYYKYYLRKIMPISALIPDTLSYLKYKDKIGMKQFLYEDNGQSAEIFQRCEKMLNPWSPCFTLQMVADGITTLLRNAAEPPAE